MNSCVFPGSFDPVTKGHMNLIARASTMFDQVNVAVMINPQKKGKIPVNKRVELLRKACASLPNVRVESWNGLLADYMTERHLCIVIRGVRSGAELEQELQTNWANRLLNQSIETVLIPADPSMAGISSSAVKEIASFGGEISAFVPECVAEEIAGYLSNK